MNIMAENDYDRSGFNSSHPYGRPWGPPWTLATLGDTWRHAWKWSFWLPYSCPCKVSLLTPTLTGSPWSPPARCFSLSSPSTSRPVLSASQAVSYLVDDNGQQFFPVHIFYHFHFYYFLLHRVALLIQSTSPSHGISIFSVCKTLYIIIYFHPFY